jgi:tetraacyldisaccharide-1-P 4'-kinase
VSWYTAGQRHHHDTDETQLQNDGDQALLEAKTSAYSAIRRNIVRGQVNDALATAAAAIVLLDDGVRAREHRGKG